MIRPDFTFSKAPLIETECRWWLTPGAVWSHLANEFMEGGTAVHKPLAVLVKGGILELPEKPALRAMYGHGKAWLEANRFRSGKPAYGLEAEVVFSYDYETREGRRYSDPPGLEGTRWYADAALRAKHGVRDTEICGRLDLVCFTCSDERGPYIQVDDYKCHFGPEHADARAQLELGALAVARFFEVDRVKVCGVHLWEDRDPLEEAYELGAWELDTVAVRLYELAYPTAANDPQPFSGAHCKALHCPARTSCPVAGEVVEELPLPGLVPAAALVRKHAPHPFLAPVTTSDQAAWKLTAIDMLEEILEKAKAEVKAFSDAHEWTDADGVVQRGIPLSDGTVYSGRPQPRTTPDLSVKGAMEAVAKLKLDFALKTTTSWSAIKETGGVAGEKAARKVFGDLGAVKTTSAVVYQARKVDAKAQSRRRAG